MIRDSVFPNNLNGFMGPGSHGTAVGLLGSGLYMAGFAPDGFVCDDYYGEKMTAAVSALQRLLNTAGAEIDEDGSFGPATRKAWARLSDEKTSGIPPFSLDVYQMQPSDKTTWMDKNHGEGVWELT